MKLTFPQLATRRRPAPDLPGLRATARVDRHTAALLARLRPGDLAVVDHLDLDRATATALVEAGVCAVVNAAPMISGRFPNLGPAVLAEAGIAMVDGVGADGFAAVRDGTAVRLHGRDLFVGDELVASGRVVDAATVREEMDRARAGLPVHLEGFLRHSAELLRREEDLLLQADGLPSLRTRFARHPAVVVAPTPEHREQLGQVRRLAREPGTVLVGVGRAADTLLAARLRPDVVILSGADDVLPRPETLRAARDVVVCVGRGTDAEVDVPNAVRVATALDPEDVGLLLAHAAGASVVVGVGLQATLEELLDRHRPGLASTYLTRLKVGPRLVDAPAVPVLHRRRLRTWPAVALLVSAVVALAAAVVASPAGQQWLDNPPSTATTTPEPAAEEGAGFSDEVLAGTAGRVYGAGLANAPVSVLAFPGVPEATMTAVTEEIGVAGGVLAGSYQVEPALVSPGEQALVDTLGSQLSTQLSATAVDEEPAAYNRIGQLLGIAIANTTGRGAKATDEAASIRQSLSGAELVRAVGTPTKRASYVVVLLGEDTDPADDPIYREILTGLAQHAPALVVAASTADGQDGRLDRLRDESFTSEVATVDGVDTPAGLSTTLLALTEWPDTRGGAYGASGADGAVSLG